MLAVSVFVKVNVFYNLLEIKYLLKSSDSWANGTFPTILY